MLRPVASTSLRGRLAGLFVLASILMLAVIGLSTLTFVNLVSARGTILGQVDPASLQADDLLLAFVDQETGVRGYVLSKDPAFLEPYMAGLTEQRAAEGRLATLLAHQPTLLASARAAEKEGAKWQDGYAHPAIAAVRNRNPKYASENALLASKQLFDSVRNHFSALDSALSRARSSAAAQLGATTDVLIGVLVAAALLIVLAGAVSWRSLKRWVTVPLLELSSDARQVAAGELTHPIAPIGPPELADLSSDIEAMRQRIVGELDTVATAQAEIASRNIDLARSNQELEQFAYVASHDLQEPLRKVTSFVQLLQQRYGSQLDERAEQYMHFAVDGAKRMQVLINDLLAFSRVGRTTEEFKEVELGACLDAALANLATLIEETGAAIEVGPLPVVQGDAGLLTSLWQNLVANSLKFRTDEKPVVRIDAVRDGDAWTCSVADNGIGIEPRFADKIFVIFQRLHGRDAYDGTGIGLAMCKKIVEFHGGRIWLDGEHRPGTRLCFVLPTREFALQQVALQQGGLPPVQQNALPAIQQSGLPPVDSPTAAYRPSPPSSPAVDDWQATVKEDAIAEMAREERPPPP